MKFPKTNPMRDKRKRNQKAAISASDPEAVIQGLAEALCDRLGITYFRLPDVLMRAVFASDRVPIHQKKEISDYISGFPDLVLFNPVKMQYLAIEIKTEGGVMSKKQEEWKEKINSLVTVGWEETEKAILGFHNNKGE